MYSRRFIKFRLNHWWQMEYAGDAFHTLMDLDSAIYLAVNGTVTSLPVFIQNILNCVLKTNEAFTGSERHGGKWKTTKFSFWGGVSLKANWDLHIIALLLILIASIVLICKSLWIKASAKCNVNKILSAHRQQCNSNVPRSRNVPRTSVKQSMWHQWLNFNFANLREYSLCAKKTR